MTGGIGHVRPPHSAVDCYDGGMNTPDAHPGRTGSRPARRMAALATLFVAASLASGQGPVEQVNALYSDIREQNRSDLVLLPVLADIERPPIGADTLKQAMLLPAGSSNWERAAAWAEGAPQVAVLNALDQITRGEELATSMAFGQPYGPSVPRALIASGMYTELGDPPSLAGAAFGFMPKLDQTACLVHVEATRRAATGDPAGAIDTLTDWLFFSRQMADRELAREAAWGYEQMITAFERIRDIAYGDARGARALTLTQLRAATSRLDERKIMRIDRLSLPQGDKIAAEQLVARVFDRAGALNAGAFSSAMAGVGSNERPLRLFSEAARWSGAAQGHANRADTAALLGSIVADFEARWRLDPFDQRNNTAPVFSRVDGNPRYAVLDAAMDDMTRLIALRQQLRAEAAGTRTALGVLGYSYQNRNLPPTLAQVRPQWISELERDPYNPGSSGDPRPPLQYFVPVRDTPGGAPHEINVVAYDSNFSLTLRDDQAVIYSVGPDRGKDWARFVSDDPNAVQGDYLIWPPVISLLRIDLRQQGLLE